MVSNKNCRMHHSGSSGPEKQTFFPNPFGRHLTVISWSISYTYPVDGRCTCTSVRPRLGNFVWEEVAAPVLFPLQSSQLVHADACRH